jgi:hypothetical protein
MRIYIKVNKIICINKQTKQNKQTHLKHDCLIHQTKTNHWNGALEKVATQLDAGRFVTRFGSARLGSLAAQIAAVERKCSTCRLTLLTWCSGNGSGTSIRVRLSEQEERARSGCRRGQSSSLPKQHGVKSTWILVHHHYLYYLYRL